MNSLIPRFSLPYGPRALASACAASLTRAIPEHGLEAVIGERQFIWTGSGRQALSIMLRALDLGDRARVAVPLFSSSAVTAALRSARCEPVYVDVDPRNLTMDPAALEGVRARVQAIVPVHLFGNACAMDQIMHAASGLPVIEDTAQSIGALSHGRIAGTFGLGSIYSFASSKAIAAGGGGAIAVNGSSDYAARVRRLAAMLVPRSRLASLRCAAMQGAKSMLFSRALYEILGNHLRSTTEDRGYLLAQIDSSAIAPSSAAAAVILAAKFSERMRRQRENSLSLIAMLRGLDGIVLPVEPPGAAYSYSLFAILAADSAERDALRRIMFSLGVDTSNVHHTCIETAARNGYSGGCPVSENAAQRVLTIPNFAGLSVRDLDRIASAFRSAVRQHRASASRNAARMEAQTV